LTLRVVVFLEMASEQKIKRTNLAASSLPDLDLDQGGAIQPVKFADPPWQRLSGCLSALVIFRETNLEGNQFLPVRIQGLKPRAQRIHLADTPVRLQVESCQIQTPPIDFHSQKYPISTFTLAHLQRMLSGLVSHPVHTPLVTATQAGVARQRRSRVVIASSVPPDTWSSVRVGSPDRRRSQWSR